jgi:hypothetical protein
LPPCRLEAFGSEVFGEEAIVQAFRCCPFVEAQGLVAIATGRHLALFGPDTALIADVYDDNIARIWRLGPGNPVDSEPALGVPFDADLRQSRGDLAFRKEDLPALTPAALPVLEEIGRALSRQWDPAGGSSPYRARSFLIRAFSQNGRSVGLFALHTVGGGPVRTLGFTYVAVLVENDDASTAIIIRDRAGEAARDMKVWRPRVE